MDSDMPPSLSAIFRRKNSAHVEIERVTNQSLFRKSVVETFDPDYQAFGSPLPIVVQPTNRSTTSASKPEPPPRVSSLSPPNDSIEYLPPPPPELLLNINDSGSNNSPFIVPDNNLPAPPAEFLERPSYLPPIRLRDPDVHVKSTRFGDATQDHELDEEGLPPPPDFVLKNDELSSVGQNLLQSDSSKTELVGRAPIGKSFKGLEVIPPAMARRKPMARKKLNELQAEGKNAIDSPGSPTSADLLPQDYILEENEERSMIEPASYDDRRLKELTAVLIEWINDELANHRIIVKDIEEDLFDGQILQKLLEKLSGVKLDVVEVTQSEELQKQKLQTVLDAANKVLGLARWSSNKWTVENIHSKNVVSIIHLLVALARHFRAPIRLPENVVVNVVVVQKRDGMLHTRTVAEELTSTYDDLGMRVERDAFDTLFDHAPDKLQVVKKSLVSFVNKHLNRVNLEVTDLDNQFHDGVYLTLLMGLLEGYFVPLYSFCLTPTTFEQKVHNVALSFDLMMDAGLAKPKARPEDLVNLDLKSTLRVLYNLFTKYKGVI